jgi:hypothetical protein
MVQSGIAICSLGGVEQQILEDVSALLENSPPLHVLKLSSTMSHATTETIGTSKSQSRSLRNSKKISSQSISKPPVTKAIPYSFSQAFHRSIDHSVVTLQYFELKDITFSKLQWEELAQNLRNLTALETFIVRNCAFSEKVLVDICNALSGIDSLRHLTIANCGLSESSILSIRHLLDTYKQRVTENAWISDLRSSAKHRHTTSEVSTGLRSLDLSGNDLGDEGKYRNIAIYLQA